MSPNPSHRTPGAHKAAHAHHGQRQWSRRSLAIGASAAALGLFLPWRLAPAAASGASLSPPPVPDFDRPPEGYAQYDGQSSCDPSAKPGVNGFKDLVLAAYPSTGNLGISRDCGVGGTSEHKEGRAWDWAVDAYSQGAIADNLLDWLLATRGGEPHALLRRFGIMYMIWNRRWLRAYRINEGWVTYNGPHPHDDHVHFSFSWAAARRQTTWWTAQDGGGSPDGCGSVNLNFDAYPPLARGSRGSAVRAAQCLLRQCCTLEADGIFGPITERAVKTYQERTGLPVVGQVGPRTWTALLSAGSTPSLRRGSASDKGAVRRLQRALTAALRTKVAIDGSFGPQTDQAVRNYQSSRKLHVDGIVGNQTWGALQSGK